MEELRQSESIDKLRDALGEAARKHYEKSKPKEEKSDGCNVPCGMSAWVCDIFPEKSVVLIDHKGKCFAHKYREAKGGYRLGDGVEMEVTYRPKAGKSYEEEVSELGKGEDEDGD